MDMHHNNHNKKIRIVVLEDNAFYNKIFSEKLKFYIEGIKLDKNFSFEIESYTHVDDCLTNLKFDTDIAFIDYYLDNGITAPEVIKKIQRQCPECNIIILSQFSSFRNSIVTILDGASEFIQKGMNTISKSCEIAEDIIDKRLKNEY